ncbi:hypothetical protein GYMLUDRAFT_158087, partial [Collybiopsis luxurians FD-317 M1]
TLFGILSSCFSVIFICVWVAIHPNVPAVKRSSYRVLFDKLCITFVALLAPELIVSWAVQQWIVARRILKKYEKYGWTKTHAYLALMGGFALYDKDGFVFHLWDPEFDDLKEVAWSSYKEQHGQYLTKDNLNHSDWVTKVIAVVQTGWFVLQCAARAEERKAITELEILTLAFALLNFATYLLWWNKPQGVRHPIRVYWPVAARSKEELSQKDVNRDWMPDWMLKLIPEWGLPWELSWLSKSRSGSIVAWIIDVFYCLIVLGVFGSYAVLAYLVLDLPFIALLGESITDDVDDSLFKPSAGVSLSGTFIVPCTASIFGSIHLLAWSFSFHTPLERLLWRIFALAMTVLPILMIVFVIVFAIIFAGFANHTDYAEMIGFTIFIIFFFAYAACRIGLVVLALMELRNLPDTAYQAVQWLQFIPHIG